MVNAGVPVSLHSPVGNEHSSVCVCTCLCKQQIVVCRKEKKRNTNIFQFHMLPIICRLNSDDKKTDHQCRLLQLQLQLSQSCGDWEPIPAVQKKTTSELTAPPLCGADKVHVCVNPGESTVCVVSSLKLLHTLVAHVLDLVSGL